MMPAKSTICFIITLFFSRFLPAQKSSPFINDPASPKKIPGYTLVWQDEFNTDGKPDSTSWIYEKGFVRNEELQWYQPGNAYCINGSLVIEGKREKSANQHYKAGSTDWKLNRQFSEFTSASIQTRGHHQWKFGRFLVRARIDTAKGSWPAIWTLGISKAWPSNGEVDIMEFYRVNEEPTLLANTAWGTQRSNVARWHSERKKLADFTHDDTDWVKKFHVWRMDWNKDSISLFLDDTLLNTTLISQTINADGSNPFLQPHYLLLNLALGGNGGMPLETTTRFKYEVDYVRVYQQAKQ